MRKVLLCLVDALSSDVVRPAVADGRLPTLGRLASNGHVRWDSVSVFPSITPAATASICTGAYPARHGILGAHYYDRDEDQVHYFGADLWVLTKRGWGPYLHDFLRHLNQRCLSAPTIFDQLEPRRSCASLNFLIHRGPVQHRGRSPWPLRLMPGVPSTPEFPGPSTLCLGDFVGQRAVNGRVGSLEARGGMFRRFGFSDDSTGDYLEALGERGLPDFTIAYFPDNDWDSHAKGPDQALDTVIKVDARLGEFARGVYGGIDQMLEEVTVVVTGDHSQTDVADDDSAAIALDETLESYRLVSAGDAWHGEDEMMVCPNLRVAQIYLARGYIARQDEVARQLLSDRRVDQVIYRDTQTHDTSDIFIVATADRGTLRFGRGAGVSKATDERGSTWWFEGALSAVHATLEEGRLRFGDYPNAFERIEGSFHSRYAGDMWVTARVGHEFNLPRTEVHVGGGSHGSLHRADSTSPLIVGTTDERLTLPDLCRAVDVADICRTALHEQPATVTEAR